MAEITTLLGEHPTEAAALLGLFLLLGVTLYIRRIKFTVHLLVQTALLLALAVLLQQLRLYHFPQGGSVTCGAMVPLLLLAFKHGPAVGALGGALYGCLNLLQDPFILHPVQVIFDYPLPFMAMGLAGFFPTHRYLGMSLAFTGRFACHFISGCIFFSSYAPEGVHPALYSLTANLTYMLPELAIAFIITKALPLDRLLAAMKQ